MESRRGRRVSFEWAFGAISLVLLVLVVLSASIRHSVLCDSGSEEETEALATLERQSLEARLLNVEQEAMENTIFVQRLLQLLEAKFGATEQALRRSAKRGARESPSFAELYDDAEKLALEIDAAFDRVDDDLFAPNHDALEQQQQQQQQQGGGGGYVDDGHRGQQGDDALSAAYEEPEEAGGFVDDRRGAESRPQTTDDRFAESSQREAAGASYASEQRGDSFGTDDPQRPPPQEELDPFVRALQRGRTMGMSTDAADKLRCTALQEQWDIVPQVTWGGASLEIQTEWQQLACDEKLR